MKHIYIIATLQLLFFYTESKCYKYFRCSAATVVGLYSTHISASRWIKPELSHTSPFKPTKPEVQRTDNLCRNRYQSTKPEVQSTDNICRTDYRMHEPEVQRTGNIKISKNNFTKNALKLIGIVNIVNIIAALQLMGITLNQNATNISAALQLRLVVYI